MSIQTSQSKFADKSGVWRSNHNQVPYKRCLIALGCAIREVQKNMEGETE
jgi:hypothetical protein